MRQWQHPPWQGRGQQLRMRSMCRVLKDTLSSHDMDSMKACDALSSIFGNRLSRHRVGGPCHYLEGDSGGRNSHSSHYPIWTVTGYIKQPSSVSISFLSRSSPSPFRSIFKQPFPSALIIWPFERMNRPRMRLPEIETFAFLSP